MSPRRVDHCSKAVCIGGGQAPQVRLRLSYIASLRPDFPPPSAALSRGQFGRGLIAALKFDMSGMGRSFATGRGRQQVRECQLLPRKQK
jgi:hypothetical protein